MPRMPANFSIVTLGRSEDHAMPEIYVYAIEGRTIDQKRALVKEITDAVVRKAPACGVRGLYAGRPGIPAAP